MNQGFATGPEASFAVEVVRKASLLTRRVRKEMVGASLTKDDRSPVTVADYAVQAMISALLQKHFPGDVLTAEESSRNLREASGRASLLKVVHFLTEFLPEANPELVMEWIDRGQGATGCDGWVLDPIDGTKGFLRGDQYAIALARLESGIVTLGALACPALDVSDIESPARIRKQGKVSAGSSGTLFLALQGKGCWATELQEDRFRPVQVSSSQDSEEAVILRSFEKGHTNVDQLEQIRSCIKVKAKPIALDSQAKYGLIAAGVGDVLFRLIGSHSPDYREKIWDHAAGMRVVEEAGGTVTDLDGKPLDFAAGRTLANNRGLIASNGHLHEIALDAVRESEHFSR